MQLGPPPRGNLTFNIEDWECNSSGYDCEVEFEEARGCAATLILSCGEGWRQKFMNSADQVHLNLMQHWLIYCWEDKLN